MSVHFEQNLNELKEKLLTMAGFAEIAVTRALKSLLDRDEAMARQVKEDDNLLDQSEIEIDELSINLLAKAPLATDLRFITVAMKISHDLERVGDEATTISRRAIELNRKRSSSPTSTSPGWPISPCKCSGKAWRASSIAIPPKPEP